MYFRRLLLCLAVLLALLVTPAHASNSRFEGKTLDEIMAAFMESKNLNINNFKMGYYNTATGETWYFEPDSFWDGASLYKLPLNMALAEHVQQGFLTWDYPIMNITLGRAQQLSLVDSNNEYSQAMQDVFGEYAIYRTAIAAYSGLDLEAQEENFFKYNLFSPRYMINVLKTLYEEPERFPNVIEYMKLARPGQFFRRNIYEYEVAQKYGYRGSLLHTAGIVYTPTPFLLVVMTNGAPMSEQLMGEVSRLMCDYTLYVESTLPPPSPSPTPTPTPTPTPSPAATAAPEPSTAVTPAPSAGPPLPEPEAPTERFIVLGGIFFAAAVCGVLLSKGKKRR